MIKQKFTLDEETGYWVVLQFPAKEKEKAEEDVRNARRTHWKNVTRKTDYVIIGDNLGAQADKAGNMRIKIRTEEEFEGMLLQE